MTSCDLRATSNKVWLWSGPAIIGHDLRLYTLLSEELARHFNSGAAGGVLLNFPMLHTLANLAAVDQPAAIDSRAFLSEMFTTCLALSDLPFEQLYTGTPATIALVESAQSGRGFVGRHEVLLPSAHSQPRTVSRLLKNVFNDFLTTITASNRPGCLWASSHTCLVFGPTHARNWRVIPGGKTTMKERLTSSAP